MFTLLNIMRYVCVYVSHALNFGGDWEPLADREPSQLLVIARWPFPWTVRVLILALPMDCLWTVHVLNSNQYTDSPWEGQAC